jgi:hypothetical protein
MPADDIEILKGKANPNIVLIAPHGRKEDDTNTGALLKEVQKIHDCPAVINEKSRKPAPLAKKPEEFETPNAEKGILDLNIREQAEKYPQFIRAISKRLKNRESAFVIWFHGIDDDDLSEQAAKLEGQDVLNCLIGYRKRPQSTGIQKGQSSVR